MTTKLADHLKDCINSQQESVSHAARNLAHLKLGEYLLRNMTDLSDSVEYNCHAGLFWFVVNNRDDLQKLMTLAPVWAKETVADVIRYSAIIQDVVFEIRAQDGALPPTCRLVAEEYVIAAKPEIKAKRYVVKCIEPVAFDSPTTTPTPDEIPV